jgi:hypothetical protein
MTEQVTKDPAAIRKGLAMPLGNAAGDLGDGLAHDAGAPHHRDDMIVGHRLPGGNLSIHYPGQACHVCDGPRAAAQPLGPRPRRLRHKIRFVAAV